jgi:hypothetical protein
MIVAANNGSEATNLLNFTKDKMSEKFESISLPALEVIYEINRKVTDAFAEIGKKIAEPFIETWSYSEAAAKEMEKYFASFDDETKKLLNSSTKDIDTSMTGHPFGFEGMYLDLAQKTDDWTENNVFEREEDLYTTYPIQRTIGDITHTIPIIEETFQKPNTKTIKSRLISAFKPPKPEKSKSPYSKILDFHQETKKEIVRYLKNTVYNIGEREDIDQKAVDIFDKLKVRPIVKNNYDKGVWTEINENLKFDSKEELPKREFRSIAADWICNSGPDFMQNLWDVAIVCSAPTSEDVPNQWEDFFKQIYNNKAIFGGDNLPQIMGDACMFMVRTSSISIPQPKSASYDVKFLYNSVKKIKSQVDFTRKADLTLLIDEPLNFINIFNLVSNNNIITPSIDIRPILNVPFNTNPIFKYDIVKKKIQMNLLVKHQCLMNHYHYDEFQYQNGLPYDQQPYWCFEDVAFIGNTTPVKFDNTTANTLEATIPFIFKRVYKVDTQKRGGKYDDLDMVKGESQAIKANNHQDWYFKTK